MPNGVKKKLKKFLSKNYNLPVLTNEGKQTMFNYFIDDVKTLEKLINKDLSAWLLRRCLSEK